jgi:hypothetical protein
MAQKRRQARVPLIGQAILSNDHGICITATTKDISQGGIGINKPADSLTQSEYRIRVSTDEGRQIHLRATLIHTSTETTGFRTSTIDEKNLAIITELVSEYQTTDDFIKQIGKHDVLEQKYVDKNGHKVSVTFDTK